MKYRLRSPVAVISLAIAGGVLAGLLSTLYQVIFDDYRGGIIPLWVGAVLLGVLGAGAAFLIVGAAFVVFLGLTRFVSSRLVILFICAIVAAAIGGAAGVFFGRGPETWVYVVIWTLVPSVYVAITFRGLGAARESLGGVKGDEPKPPNH